MNDYKDSVMIALLPMTTDWCKTDLPHMTLVYAGEKPSLKPTMFNEMAKDAASIAMIANPISLKVLGVEVFGDEEKVDVLRLRPSTELWAMRRQVEHWNASEHPFRPHATIGPVSAVNTNTEMIPSYLAFDRLMVCWGEEYLTFWLKR